jgi:hypothetical protein
MPPFPPAPPSFPHYPQQPILPHPHGGPMIANVDDVAQFLADFENNSKLYNINGTKEEFMQNCCYECMAEAQKACANACDTEWKKEKRRRLNKRWSC